MRRREPAQQDGQCPRSCGVFVHPDSKWAFYNNYVVSLLKAEAVPFPPSSQYDRVLADLLIVQSRVRNFAGRGVPDFTASCPWELPYHKGMSCTGCKSLVTAITGSWTVWWNDFLMRTSVLLIWARDQAWGRGWAVEPSASVAGLVAAILSRGRSCFALT